MKLLEGNKLLIRVAKPEDIKTITELQISAIETLYKKNYSLQQIQALTQNKNRKQFWDEIVFIAEKEGKVLGFASLLKYRKVINGIYIDPNFTCQKIETKLLTALEKEALKRNISVLSVTSSLTDRAFYASRGYTTIANCNFWKMGVLVPCVAMKKQLVTSNKDFSLLGFLPQVTFATIVNFLFWLLLL